MQSTVKQLVTARRWWPYIPRPVCVYAHKVPCACNASSRCLHGGHIEVDHSYRHRGGTALLLLLDSILTQGTHSSSSVASATSESKFKHWPPCGLQTWMLLKPTSHCTTWAHVNLDNQWNISSSTHFHPVTAHKQVRSGTINDVGQIWQWIHGIG